MRLAIISDIHSNYFALQAVIKDIEKHRIKKIIILGDIFGYYPWAVETYRLLKPYLGESVSICGNHDKLLLSDREPKPLPSYWSAAQDNKKNLALHEIEALKWLTELKLERKVQIEDLQINLCHGTPDDPENGRFYPEDVGEYAWFPKENQVLLLGHTHYPFLRHIPGKGIIFNPGSIGQPRDGDPMPSWGIIEAKGPKFTLMRSVYNNLEVMDILEKQNWEKRAIAALNKTNKGALK